MRIPIKNKTSMILKSQIILKLINETMVVRQQLIDIYSVQEFDKLEPMEKTQKRIEGIRQMCGDLCDTAKNITPGDLIGSVTAKVSKRNPQTL